MLKKVSQNKRNKIENIKEELGWNYLNRENYLSRFNTIKECREELTYLEYRIKDEIDLLTLAILEMKYDDVSKIDKRIVAIYNDDYFNEWRYK